MPGLVGFDCEATGLDAHHGARPFYITLCDENDATTSWDWDVDPLTRAVKVIKSDLLEIKQHLHDKDVVGQNLKFDVTMLSQVDPWFFHWDWDRTYDMLDAAHLLASNELKNQTVLVLKYLRVNLKPWEDALEKCVKECRSMVQQARLRIKRRNTRMVEQRSKDDEQDLDAADWKQDEFLATWAIAEEGRGDMPSAKEKTWAFDFWLPKQIAKHLSYESDHRYWTANSDYSDRDSASCVPCWKQMRTLIEKRGYWSHYEDRRKLFRVNFLMENHQVAISKEKLQEVREDFRNESQELESVCVNIAKGMKHALSLPKGGRNKSLDTFIFDNLKLPVVSLTENGAPAMNKDVMREWLLTVEGKPLSFLKRLAAKRIKDTCISYMNNYERYGLPLPSRAQGMFGIFPHLNRTGTKTLRWGSTDPNIANIGKKKEENEGWGLRVLFGPESGREWVSIDAKNIELRIPAFEAGEEELMALFLSPNAPPFYGSEHMLNFSVVFPEIWDDAVRKVRLDKAAAFCKKEYKDTYYQWVKNGDFALQYNCGRATAERAFHRLGAFSLLKKAFPKKEALNQKQIQHSNMRGYVETIPDRTVDPEKGYPLQCYRVSPTIPLAYHVSGSAMQWTNSNMVKTQAVLDRWRDDDGFDAHIALQVHDELVFDMPRRGCPVNDVKHSNRERIEELKSVMESTGDDFIIRIPTPVGVGYSVDNWGDEVTLY